jgi:predicted nucleic-acid-binding protein
MTTYQLDTNVLLRYLTRDIPTQAKQALQLVNQAEKKEVTLEICEPVFIETAVMLRNYYKFPKTRVVNFLKDLLLSPCFRIENSHLLSLAIVTYSQSPIDFVDSILLIRSQTLNHKLFSFDRHLTSLAQ